MSWNHRLRRVALILLIIGAPILLLASVASLARAGATPPVVDLNGDAAGIDYAEATFTEDEGPRAIVSATGLTLSNGDDTLLTAARAVLTNRPDGGQESLAADPLATGLVVKYTPGSGELSIKGTATITDYQQVMRTLTYNNLSPSPDPADRFIEVTVSDGAQISIPALSTVAINAVNDAPMLDNSGDMALVSINEDDLTSNGNSVGRIIESAELGGEDRITDVDEGALEGFAVIEAFSANGQWQYSLNAGATWQSFGAVSNTAAVLLDEVARIRFMPVPGYHGSAGFSFRAWDQTMGENGDRDVDVSLNGGSSAFSAASEMATIDIVSVNDLPLVDLNGPDAGSTYQTNFYQGGPAVNIADSDATVSDADATTLNSLTLTLTNRPDGAAEGLATTTAGTNITAAAYDPATGRLHLTGPDSPANFEKVLRLTTYDNAAAAPSSPARLVEVVANDGINPGNVAVATILIGPENSAPVLDAAMPLSLGNVAEDSAQPTGRLIAEMLTAAGDLISDPDEGALEGLALIGADSSHGAWQYSLINPPTGPADWQPVGVVSETAALLLDDTAWLRFVPAADYAGPSGQVAFRAWDRTSGAAGQRADATKTGGTTAFSAAQGVLSALVTPVNDPPALGGLPLGALTYHEDAPALPLLPAAVVSDLDSATLAWATVRLTDAPDGDAEQLAATASGGIAVDFEDGVLQLSGAAPAATYQQVLRMVTYWNASQDPTAAERHVEVSIGDAQATATPQVVVVQVTPINDPPSLDLDGVGTGEDYEATFYINRGPVPIVATSLLLSDIDNTTIKLATVRITNLLNPQAEVLSADVSGSTNIKRAYDPASGILQLTGTDSVANYQRVLRTITYRNILPQPDRTDRVIEFVVDDGTGQSEARHSTVLFRVAPAVQLLMPMVAHRTEEPNDVCGEAFGLALNRDVPLMPDDAIDWFTFELTALAELTVELRDFTPLRGQVNVAAGAGCQQLELIGTAGQPGLVKIVSLGVRQPGRYYVRVITDGPTSAVAAYRLFIRAEAP